MRSLSVQAPRRDPAPSRVAYRFQRLWLTPVFRSLVRTGLPSFALVVGLGAYLTDEATQDTLDAAIADLRASVAERPEFTVNLMAIDGASDGLAEDIREILSLDFPLSSFDLDIDAIHERVSGLDAVASARLQVRSGGILSVEIVERVPAVVWRTADMLELLDAEGRRVAAIDSRTERPDLPLLAGVGADAAVPQALDILAAAAPLADRLRGLVRMGERRWDLVLDRDQRIQLPETAPIIALEKVIALDKAQDLLARDISVIDMRNPVRPTLRLAEPALEELTRIRAIERGGQSR